MNTIRAVYRLLFFAFYTLWMTGSMVWGNLFSGPDMRRTLRLRRTWARRLLPQLGYRIQISGEAPDFPCIVVANHRSYLDPALLAHDVTGYGVAKAEVARWPVIGWGARVAGVLFLHRENPHSRKIVLEGIADKVREGFPVILFAEGTTSGGPGTIDFKPGVFKLAARDGLAIVPAAVEFQSPEDYWLGDDTFLPHLMKRLAVSVKPAFVHYGPVMRGDDAEDLLQRAKNWIDAELALIRKGF